MMAAMRTVTVSWQPDRDRFQAVGRNAGRTVAIDAPHETPAPTGFSPKELLLASAGSCSAWDVIDILRKKRESPTGIDVEVHGEQPEDGYPRPFTRITLVYRVHGDVTRAAVERAVELSVERYCPVLATVRAVADVITEVALPAADGATPRRWPARTHPGPV